MNAHFFRQICETLNSGIVVLDEQLHVTYWNRWLELYCQIPAEKILNKPITDFYPNLNNPTFLRNCKTVLTFGNHLFLSQKLHGYLIPINITQNTKSDINLMQQTCYMFPLRTDGKITHICICIYDVTEVVLFQQRLIELNKRDPLTKAYNRRYLDERLREEFARHRRFNHPLSVLMLDIDHFKQINDRFGHLCGDAILIGFAKTISENIRNIDVLARYGGEEFCCVLPETDLESAKTVAERLRSAVQASKYTFKNDTHSITTSIGVSTLTPEIHHYEDLLKNADIALYKAKNSGRNIVCVAT